VKTQFNPGGREFASPHFSAKFRYQAQEKPKGTSWATYFRLTAIAKATYG